MRAALKSSRTSHRSTADQKPGDGAGRNCAAERGQHLRDPRGAADCAFIPMHRRGESGLLRRSVGRVIARRCRCGRGMIDGRIACIGLVRCSDFDGLDLDCGRVRSGIDAGRHAFRQRRNGRGAAIAATLLAAGAEFTADQSRVGAASGAACAGGSSAKADAATARSRCSLSLFFGSSCGGRAQRPLWRGVTFWRLFSCALRARFWRERSACCHAAAAGLRAKQGACRLVRWSRSAPARCLRPAPRLSPQQTLHRQRESPTSPTPLRTIWRAYKAQPA